MAALRNGNMHGDYNKLFACRICDCIFTSQKDLFDHIQLHLLLDESETKRKLLLSHMSSTSHPPAPPIHQQGWHWPKLSSALPPGVINVNPFSIGANARNLDQQSTVRPLPVSFHSTALRNISITPPTLVPAPPQIMTVQQSCAELLARPFLQQLEESLEIDGMASIKDGIEGNQEELDVTLKL
ncbi:hypothetical protein HRI_000708800 [Hibiscus trionum]|uniref:C2H2-type domain-containing protein n=1 Tax=Hibiscus trionum TaxID=183268 RepID=A0A9W7H3K6_HIBTR|nr:hypothetical protein HRI_000708800 [Hibiscus trionum]